MENKKSKAKAQQHRRNDARISKTGPAHRQFWWWLVIALIVVGAGLISAKFAKKNNDQTRPPQSTVKSDMNPSPEPTSADTAWDPSWPSLPVSGQPARPIEVVRQAYAYAVRRSDVLQYMPCYCGCEKQGHRSNYACFMRGKTAAGVPQWDEMGYT